MVTHQFDSKEISHISFINTAHEVVASSNPAFVGLTITESWATGGTVEPIRTLLGDDQVFVTGVPIERDGTGRGSLVISWTTDEIDREIATTVRNATLELLTILLFIGGVLFYASRKYKMNIKLAFFDAITGLPNATFLKEELESFIKEKSGSRAILLLNIQNLHTVDITYGSAYGDQVLAEAASVISSRLRAQDLLFAYRADQLVLLFDHYEAQHELEDFANDILAQFGSDKELADIHHVNLAIGIVEVTDSHLSVDKLLQNASLALEAVPENAKRPFRFFSAEMEAIVHREDRIEKALREVFRGKKKEQFFLNFQPKLDLRTRTIKGYEALACMRLSDLGFVSPVEFIEIAEKRILIYDLGKQVLHRTCEFIKELQADGFTQFRVAVNISGAQLLRQEFLNDVQEIIAAHGVETTTLEFEVTESVLFDNFELVNQKLRMIKEMGISISLDDFGTGYSSFSRLRELYIDTVKIDRYFVSKISGADDPDSILSDIISMAHKIGLTVVAEGVEDETQENYLEQHGCDIVQGYLYAKPLSQAEAIEFIQKVHR